MSVLIFLDQADGQIRKSSLEAASYGVQIAKQLDVAAEAVVLGTIPPDLASLGKYGIKKVYTVNNPALDQLDAQVSTKVLAEVATNTGATVVVFSNNVMGKTIAPRLSVRLKAGLVSGAIALPDTTN